MLVLPVEPGHTLLVLPVQPGQSLFVKTDALVGAKTAAVVLAAVARLLASEFASGAADVRLHSVAVSGRVGEKTWR